LKLKPVARRYRRANHDVLFSGITAQQGVEGRQQCYEQAGAFLLAQSLESWKQRVGKYRRLGCSAKALLCRPRPIGRPLQQGRSSCKLCPPVIELLLLHLTVQPGALPYRKVGILNG